MAFLMPGAMSLGAQLGGDVKIVWRIVFVVAALFGAISNAMFIRAFPASSSQIEDTQSSFADLLRFESDQSPLVPLDDVQQVSR